VKKEVFMKYVLFLLILYSTSTLCVAGYPDESSEINTVLSIWGGFDALPGGNGGEILLQAGANKDIGDGSDGDLSKSIRIASGERFYRQVTPGNQGLDMIEPFIVTVAGNVTIHCQYLFNASVLMEPGANLTIIAGQPLWISPPSLAPFMEELETLEMPHTVSFANSEPGGHCCFQFYTTAHGNIRPIGVLGTPGGDSDTPGIDGGNGGDITIINDVCDVTLVNAIVSGGRGCNGSGSDESGPASAGGNGGRLAIRAKTIHLINPVLALAANGGDGGNGASFQTQNAYMDGDDGGDGGKILLDAESIDVANFELPIPGAPEIPGLAAITVDGGEGGRGGDSNNPKIPPGNGGDGGVPGEIQFIAATTSSVSARPGDGGEAGRNLQDQTTGQPGVAGSGTSSVNPPDLPEKVEDKWTIMTYIAADNEEECFLGVCHTTEDDWVLCLDAMEETCFSGTPVNVVVQMDRYPGEAQRELSIPESAASTWGFWDDTRRGFLAYDGISGISTVLTPVIEGGIELNTGAPEPLVDFVKWARRVAPAKHEMLILCGHGGGWRGFLHDSSTPMVWTGWPDPGTPPLDRIEMDELQTAMAGIEKVDVLFMHTCIGASIEAITSALGHADFYISTEEIIDRKSFWYDWYSDLATNSDLPAADLAQQIVKTWGGNEVFCLCDMTKIGPLNESIRAFVDAMCHPSSTASETERRRLWNAAVVAVKNTNDIGLGNRDIVGFMYELRTIAWGDALEETDLPVTIRDVCQKAFDVVRAVHEACPIVEGENAEWESGKNLNGICVYLPEREIDPHYEARANAGRNAFAHNTGWLEFITTLSAYANGQ
jgi:hypothetical protein